MDLCFGIDTAVPSQQNKRKTTPAIRKAKFVPTWHASASQILENQHKYNPVFLQMCAGCWLNSICPPSVTEILPVYIPPDFIIDLSSYRLLKCSSSFALSLSVLNCGMWVVWNEGVSFVSYSIARQLQSSTAWLPINSVNRKHWRGAEVHRGLFCTPSLSTFTYFSGKT